MRRQQHGVEQMRYVDLIHVPASLLHQIGSAGSDLARGSLAPVFAARAIDDRGTQHYGFRSASPVADDLFRRRFVLGVLGPRGGIEARGLVHRSLRAKAIYDGATEVHKTAYTGCPCRSERIFQSLNHRCAVASYTMKHDVHPS